MKRPSRRRKSAPQDEGAIRQDSTDRSPDTLLWCITAYGLHNTLRFRSSFGVRDMCGSPPLKTGWRLAVADYSAKQLP